MNTDFNSNILPLLALWYLLKCSCNVSNAELILIAAIAASKCLCGNGFGSVNNNCGCNN